MAKKENRAASRIDTGRSSAGANDLPQEDALVLQLQLSKDQKKLVEALRSQQEEVRELQRLLGEQQGALVLQQREILEQQRRLFQQLEEVRRS